MNKKTFEIKGNIKNSYIAFIDILGFKELVNNKIDKVIEALSFIENYCEEFYNIRGIDETNDAKSICATMFSDSIVITMEQDDINDELLGLNMFIDFISHLQHSLLLRNVLIRGGITIGEIYHKGNMVFGKGLQEAYFLESEISEVPRIILSDSIISFYKTRQEKISDMKIREVDTIKRPFTFFEEIDNIIKKDFDEFYYIDYYYKEKSLFIDYEIYENIKLEDLKNTIDFHNEKIDSIIKENIYSKNLKVRKKIVWLKNRHEEFKKFYNSKINSYKIE